ncbi:MAG: diguanylate cyclase [Thermodesulfobacteriota bacterium]
MSKDYKPLTKCLSTNTWIKYIKDNGWSTSGIYDGIDYNESFMCDVENWMPSDQVYRLCQNITKKFPDNPNLFYDMAIFASEKNSVGAISTIAKSFSSPVLIYKRSPKLIENYNKHRKIDVVKITKNFAILDTFHMTEVKAIREVCEWTRGIFAAVPKLIGLSEATVTEVLCEENGDHCCRYEIRWQNRKGLLQTLFEKLSGKSLIEEQRNALEISQQKLLERFEALESAKYTIEDYVKNLEQKVQQRTEELENANRALEKLSFTDGLTKIFNRRYFDQQLITHWSHHQRNSRPMSLILCDIDFFKQYNDTYGHQAGDECIKSVAKSLEVSVTRSHDQVARYGGEEFAILLPETDEQGAHSVALNLKDAVFDLQIPHQDSTVSNMVSLSFGIATLVSDGMTNSSKLISLADKALYQSKRSGRNCITIYQGS